MLNTYRYRLLHGWTLVRWVYLGLGLAVIANAWPHGEWIGGLLGGYLAFMGLFGVGCAGGNCAVPSSSNIGANEVTEEVVIDQVNEKRTK